MREYSYAFVDARRFPVWDYLGTLRVTPITESGWTFAEWFGTYEVDTADAAEADRAFTGIYRAFLIDLERYLGTPDLA